MSAQHIILTQRDTNIILMCYLYSGCSIDHICQKFFPHTKSPRACYRRVSELVKYGYLLNHRLPSLTGVGSGRTFLTVGPNARPLLAHMLGLSQSELARIRLSAPRIITHHLAICDTRLAFELAVERSAVFTSVDWTADRQVELKVQVEGKEVTITPDGSFTLSLRDGRRQQFLLEQDMGTMTNSKRMRARLSAHLISSQASSVPVLFVTTTPQRLAALARLTQEEAERLGANPSMIWLTTKERVTAHTVLDSPIWTLPGQSQPVTVSSLVAPPRPADVPSDDVMRASLAAALGMPAYPPLGSPAFPGGFES